MSCTCPCACPAGAAGGCSPSVAPLAVLPGISTQGSHPGQELELLMFVAALWFHHPVQNLFPGSVLLPFLTMDEECCAFLISCLWAIQGCAVTVKILNLNLVIHSVCCPYGSGLYSQFYFTQCQFPDFPVSSNVGEL